MQKLLRDCRINQRRMDVLMAEIRGQVWQHGLEGLTLPDTIRSFGELRMCGEGRECVGLCGRWDEVVSARRNTRASKLSTVIRE